MTRDPSRWQVKITSVSEIQANVEKAIQVEDSIIARVKVLEPMEEKEWLPEIARRLGWQYQYINIASRAAKTTVTEMKRKFDHEVLDDADTVKRRNLNKQPRFLQQDKGLTPAEKGTAIHTVMQHISLEKAPILEEVQELLELLVHREIITPEQATAVSPDIILDFFTGPLGELMLKAKKVIRELPFSLALPAQEVYPELTEAETDNQQVLIQGIIDCLVEQGEDGGLVIIDYKSDAVWPGQDSPAERYRLQINLYARAVEEILGREVEGKYIYLFHTGEAIKM
ncbi:hypothetical protein N752_26030 [Desulforamulus aquiferis]|nr:PD-(D/E)XK nuclease family protein [Desulforamulus aquiferis]RYD02275.1 hypothetical protein N752_26030 [Desulforamulus aquiferis]